MDRRFRAMLMEISKNLSSEDLSALKFVCRGIVKGKKSEEIQSGTDLFECLIQRKEIGPDNTDLLKEYLNQIHQETLVDIILKYEGESPSADLPEKHELEKIDIATNVIVENLGRKWREYGRKLGIKDGRLDSIDEKFSRNLEEKVRAVIKEWLKTRKGEASVNELTKALRACNQNYTADLVEKEVHNITNP